MTRSGPLQHVSAGSLSLLVHGMLLALLLFGVSMHGPTPRPVEAELWNALPEPPAPPPPVSIPVEPIVKLAAKTGVPPPEVDKSGEADIALARARKREQVAAAKATAEQAALDKAAKDAAQKTAAEALRREKQRKRLEQEIANQARADLDSEDDQLRARASQSSTEGRTKALISEAQDRIRNRIHSYLHEPSNLVGNPEVIYRVILLPNGEVLRAVLLRSSGQPAYDREVERAILKASPLPLPRDPDAAAAFRDGLNLRFRPQETAAAGD